MPHWISSAKAKGYDIVARVIDRFHLALRCRLCGAVIKVRLFTLMSAQPLCPTCVQTGWISTAEAAGLTYLGRCPEDRHYAFYEAPCGHQLRRQIEILERVATGETGVRCDICHKENEQDEATAQGWRLIGRDPDGNANYRSYQHGACGHVQRIARVNMQSGRVGCGGCGEKWTAAPSHLYAMQFVMPNSRRLVKVGYSNNPASRLYHQLSRDPNMPRKLLRTIPVASGQMAITLEKALHRKLRDEHPDAVVDPDVYHGLIKVQSEIYDAALTAKILAELEAIASRIAPPAS
ncbi:conserved hypothetical protein [Roseovarius sp. EC-HK134]|nr:conserved hypothetical protein [Roseovarius sp. EC-HK134]